MLLYFFIIFLFSFNLFNFNNIDASDKILDCENNNLEIGENCKDGYFFNYDKNIYEKCSLGCRKCKSKKICLKCQCSYKLFKDKCFKKYGPDKYENCDKNKGDLICDINKSEFEYEGKCKKCDSNCKTCWGYKTYCFSCNENYTLNTNHKCIKDKGLNSTNNNQTSMSSGILRSLSSIWSYITNFR